MNGTEASAEQVHRCLRPGCGRTLTSPESIARGMGRHCARMVREAAKSADLTAWTPRQVEQARELIEDGGIVAADREGDFWTVSTDGTEVYLTSAVFCSCAAGQASRLCYHRCSAVIVLASTAPATPIVYPLPMAA